MPRTGRPAAERLRPRAPSQSRSAIASLPPAPASFRTRSSRRSACSRSASSSSASTTSASATRVHAPVRVRDLLVAVRPDHVADRVGLADLGQEPVAEPLARRRAPDESRDVVELDRLGHLRAGPGRLRNRGQPLVGDLDDGDVGLDRREGIGRPSRAAARVRALKSVVLPAFGRPTMPIFTAVPGVRCARSISAVLALSAPPQSRGHSSQPEQGQADAAAPAAARRTGSAFPGRAG